MSETEIQTEIRNLAKKFAEKELLPVVAQDEETGTFRPELIQKLGNLGLAGIATSEKYGGAGLGYQEYAIALEEIGSVSASYAISIAVSGLPQIILSQFGTEEQKQKYIPRLSSGEAIGSFSLSEVGSGSDAGQLKATAQKKGDHYLLNGSKFWTTQGDSAEVLVVFARTSDDGSRGISAFILEKDTPGFTLGKKEKKMGLEISHTMELLLKDVKISKSNLIGKEGDGFKIAMTALNSGRITIGATANGISRAALEVAARYANERHQFGKPIGENQGVSFLLADMATHLEAARLLVWKAASLKDQNKPHISEAAMAKLYATDTCMHITTDAVQILGGAGYTREFPLERFMREAKVMQIVEGTNQIQRMVIGRQLLRKSQ